MDLKSIAKICHEANRSYCELLGDNSQPKWEDAPEWQVSSCIDGVVFHMYHPDAGDSASHDNWMEEKKRDGWKYGSSKDPENKEHPCMVPFNELPVEQQLKDKLFRSIVHVFM